MHNHLELVVHERLEVQVTDLHDDFKSNEMGDAMFNCVLQWEHMKIDGLCNKSHEDLNKSDDEWDLRAMVHE